MGRFHVAAHITPHTKRPTFRVWIEVPDQAQALSLCDRLEAAMAAGLFDAAQQPSTPGSTSSPGAPVCGDAPRPVHGGGVGGDTATDAERARWGAISDRIALEHAACVEAATRGLDERLEAKLEQALLDAAQAHDEAVAAVARAEKVEAERDEARAESTKWREAAEREAAQTYRDLERAVSAEARVKELEEEVATRTRAMEGLQAHGFAMQSAIAGRAERAEGALERANSRIAELELWCDPAECAIAERDAERNVQALLAGEADLAAARAENKRLREALEPLWRHGAMAASRQDYGRLLDAAAAALAPREESGGVAAVLRLHGLTTEDAQGPDAVGTGTADAVDAEARSDA